MEKNVIRLTKITYLTNEDYTTLLRIVGRSAKPLSSYGIKLEMEKAGIKQSSSHHVYFMLNRLLDDNDNSDIKGSFRWAIVPGNKTEQNHLVDILNGLYGLNLDKQETQFHKSQDEKVLTVSYGSAIKIKFEIYAEYGHARAILQLYNFNNRLLRETHIYNEKDDKLLFIKRPKKFEEILANRRPNIGYLFINLDEKSAKDISDNIRRRQEVLQCHNKNNTQITSSHTLETVEIDNQVLGLWNDKRKRRYSLNIRGLILYLLGEIRLEEELRKVHNKRIIKVLENLSVNNSEHFTFLMFYKDFREELNRLSNLTRIPKFFDIELLKDIARELQDQVYHASEHFLLYWLTKRFSGGITKYFATSDTIGFQYFREVSDSFKYLSLEKIQKYQLTNFKVIEEYLSSELKHARWISNNLRNRIDSNFSLNFWEIDHDFLLADY